MNNEMYKKLIYDDTLKYAVVLEGSCVVFYALEETCNLSSAKLIMTIDTKSYSKDFIELSTDTFTLDNVKYYVVPYYDCVFREDGKEYRMNDYGLSPDSAYVNGDSVLIHFNTDHTLIPFPLDYFATSSG